MTPAHSALLSNEIVQTVGRLGGGSLEEVAAALPRSMSRPTLRRRLAGLVLAERLVVEGRGQSSWYALSAAEQGRVVPVKAALPLVRPPRGSLSEPSLFRLRYQQQLNEGVSEVVRCGMARPTAEALLRLRFGPLPPDDRERCIEIALAELAELHEGNIARYQVRACDFERWQRQW